MENLETRHVPASRVVTSGKTIPVSTSISSKTVPNLKNSVPTSGKTVPNLKNSVPTSGKAVPNLNNSVPTSGKTVPNLNNSVPTSGKTVPNLNNSVPTSGKTVSNLNNSVPTSGKTVPNLNNSVPTSGKTIPKKNNSVWTSGKALQNLNNSIPLSGKDVPQLNQSDSSTSLSSSSTLDMSRETVTSYSLPTTENISPNHLLFHYHLCASVEKPLFESDPLVLKNSVEYQEVLQKYVALLAQRTIAIRDIDRLENLRVSAVKDPSKFIAKLQIGDLSFPCRQKMVDP